MIFIILCLLAVIVTSYLIGALFVKEGHGLFATLLGGFLTELALWEIISLPAIFLELSLTALSLTIQTVIIVFCVNSIFRNRGRLLDPWKNCLGDWWGRIVRFFTLRADLKDVVALVALGIVLVQALLLVVGVHYDDDDAFYVATATTAIDTNTIYRYTPFTGAEYSDLPARYVLSPWPMFSAVLSYIFNIRPIIVFHTLLPALIIPMSYGVLYMMGRVIWREDPDRETKTYGFLIAASFLQIFGAFSTWSVGMRLLIRVWQGKTVLASVIIPLLMVLIIYDWHSEKLSRHMFFYIITSLLAGCFMSSMGVVLPVIELGVLGLTRAIVKKDIRYTLQLIPCCAPNLLLGVIYLAIR
ncbi:MAG: hypothetical protein K6B14_04710 [Lachnospiraceae bacterium]|nr:hypothetical protein [Lachnospiraceae bacterium]